MQISLPEKVNKIIQSLNEAGYEAYAVGGCVRDRILEREPEDWDITTSASPGQVKELFRRTVDTGIQHGTVTVMSGKEGFEVTTYRIDGIYEDNRHPSEVVFTSSLAEDLKRRDFTVNAMAYNAQDGLIDLFGGMEDIRKKQIRCVGKAEERFAEDALRLMRAVRFSAQLGYDIEEKTKAAICRQVSDLQYISAERIRIELVKLLTSPHPEYLAIAYETGITSQILPEFDACMQTGQNCRHHCYSVGEHILYAMCRIEPHKVLRLTMLLHDIAKPLTKTVDEDGTDHFHGHPAKSEEMAVRILKRLKFDNDTIDKVSRLVRWHDYEIEPEAVNLRRALAKIGKDLFPFYLKVKTADVAAQSSYRQEEKMARLKEIRLIYEEVLAADNCISLKELAITGADLIAAGMSPGKEMGVTLNRLLEDVIDYPEHNNKEYLLYAAFNE